jgi:hypothetical protein
MYAGCWLPRLLGWLSAAGVAVAALQWRLIGYRGWRISSLLRGWRGFGCQLATWCFRASSVQCMKAKIMKKLAKIAKQYLKAK